MTVAADSAIRSYVVMGVAGAGKSAVGAALVVHAAWYFSTGTWHGYGDGVQLYHELGVARYPVAIAAGLVTCSAAYLGARGVFGALADTLPSSRAVGVCVACVLAAGVHVGLAV